MFELYKNGTYHESDSVANVLIKKYPESNITDKLAYIKLLCKLKSEGPSDELLDQLNAFKIAFPESPLVANTSEIIETIEKIKPLIVPKNPQ